MKCKKCKRIVTESEVFKTGEKYLTGRACEKHYGKGTLRHISCRGVIEI